MNCRNCCQELQPSEKFCPQCGDPVSVVRLAADRQSDLANSAREALSLARAESYFDRDGALAELTRDLQSPETALSPAELDHLLEAGDAGRLVPLEQLQNLLDSGGQTGLTIEGIALSDLLEQGVDGRDLLRKGMLFLKNRKYAESVEWWQLNRRQLNNPQSPLDLLLILMEMVTWNLLDHRERVADLRNQIRLHPYRSKLRSP